MDCQTCESLLLDIAYGELAPRVETEARTHLARCAQCSAALTRIESGLAFAKRLPMVEPPTALADRLMQAARERVPAAARAPQVSLLERWADLMRRFAMARQVQMATVMLLIVVVGLWSVPQLTRRREAQGGTVINPETDGEAGPSAALSPAAPLDLAVDPRTGRIRAKGELAEAARMRPESPKAVVAEGSAPTDQAAMPTAESEAADLALVEGAAYAPGEAEQPLADEQVAERSARQDKAPEPEARAAFAAEPLAKEEIASEGFAAAPPPAKLSATRASSGDATPAIGTQSVARTTAAAAKPAVRSSKAKSDDAMPMDNPYTRGNSGFSGVDGPQADAMRQEKKGASAGAAPSPATPASTTTLYARAMESYRAADYGSARASFETLLARSDAGAQRSAALLYLARSQRALGRCDLAAPHYETLVLQHASSAEAAPALAEAVGCYDQLGQPARADSLLARASKTPALAVRARQTSSARSSTPKAAAKPAAGSETK